MVRRILCYNCSSKYDFFDFFEMQQYQLRAFTAEAHLASFSSDDRQSPKKRRLVR